MIPSVGAWARDASCIDRKGLFSRSHGACCADQGGQDRRWKRGGDAVALEKELETYKRELPRLIQEGGQGKFALVHGDSVDSVWDTWKDALQAGYDRFGLEPFLVKEIQETERPVFFTRDI